VLLISFLIVCDLVFKPDDEVFELIDFFEVLACVVGGLCASLLVVLEFFLAFLEGEGEFVLDVFHLADEDLFVFESFLEDAVLFAFAFEFELSEDLVFLLLGGVGGGGGGFGGAQGRVAHLGSGLGGQSVSLLVVDGLFLGEVGEVHALSLVRFSVKTFLGVGPLFPHQTCVHFPPV
jgi:hypothetical protein